MPIESLSIESYSSVENSLYWLSIESYSSVENLYDGITRALYWRGPEMGSFLTPIFEPNIFASRTKRPSKRGPKSGQKGSFLTLFDDLFGPLFDQDMRSSGANHEKEGSKKGSKKWSKRVIFDPF